AAPRLEAGAHRGRGREQIALAGDEERGLLRACQAAAVVDLAVVGDEDVGARPFEKLREYARRDVLDHVAHQLPVEEAIDVARVERELSEGGMKKARDRRDGAH